MRITTFNINSLRARLHRFPQWLDKHQTDVVCLQETKCTDDVFPAHVFEERGYHVSFHGQKTYNGVAIASLAPQRDVVRGLPLDGDDEARGIAATIHGVRVINVYVVNGKEVGHEKYHHKLRWLDALCDFVEADVDPDGRAVLCGDFNLCPSDDDTWDAARWQGGIFCTEAERARFQRLLDHGLFDAFREKYPTAFGPYFHTWWDYRQAGFDRNRGLRIDHHLVTRAVLDRTTAVTIDRVERAGEKPSDHAPVTLSLDWSMPG